MTLAAEAQPAKLRKVGGYHLGANDEHAAVLTPAKLRKISGLAAKIHRTFRGSPPVEVCGVWLSGGS